MRAVAAGEIVEQSMTRPPAASPSPTPPGPRMTASTSGVSETHTTTTSEARATSAGEPASEPPSATRSAARPGVRFHAVTSNPARRRLAAIAAPIVPSPTNPIRSTRYLLLAPSVTRTVTITDDDLARNRPAADGHGPAGLRRHRDDRRGHRCRRPRRRRDRRAEPRRAGGRRPGAARPDARADRRHDGPDGHDDRQRRVDPDHHQRDDRLRGGRARPRRGDVRRAQPVARHQHPRVAAAAGSRHAVRPARRRRPGVPGQGRRAGHQPRRQRRRHGLRSPTGWTSSGPRSRRSSRGSRRSR